MDPSSLLFGLLGALLISPSLSLNCTSQTFSTHAPYANCSDLAALNATLHWTYNQTLSTLSVAFVARPANTSGWISWGINPTSTGMIGAMAFIAFNDPRSNNTVALKTYNLTSYGGITEQKMPWKVLNSSAEAAAGRGGVMRIFATMELPKNMSATLNHVWQVGSAVSPTGVPQMHSLGTDNTQAKAPLELSTGKSIAPAVSPAAAPAGDTETNATTPASPEQSPGSGTGGSSGNWKINGSLYSLFAVLGVFGLVL